MTEAADQPLFRLPMPAVLGVDLACGAMAAGLWACIVSIGPWGMETMLPGLLATGIATGTAMTGTALIRPGKPRPVLALNMLLIAASLGRVVITIGACLLLYFAARQPAGPLLLGAMAGLLLILVGETAFAARSFAQTNA